MTPMIAQTGIFSWLAHAYSSVLNGWLTPMIFAAAAILLFLFRRHVTDAVLHVIFTRSRRQNREQYLSKKKTVQASLGALIAMAFLAAACYLVPGISEPWGTFVLRAANSLLVAASFWFLYKVVFLVVIQRKTRSGIPLGAGAVSFLGSMIRALIVVVGFFIILSFWVSNLSGLVAGLGIGGLAISLAAQDSIGNLLGSLSILMDGTFKVGDYIETADFSGTVEEIGIRTSKIRDFNGARASVPNKILAQSVVTNATERKRRRIEIRVTVCRGASIERFMAFKARVTETLEKRQDIEQPATVVLESLTPEGLVLYVTCFAGSDYLKMLETRSDICRDIAALAETLSLPLYTPNLLLVQKDNEQVNP